MISNISKEEIERYSRQIILPEIGLNGQNNLNNSKVLIVGAGGIGASVILYLAACGIKTLGIIDGDKVEKTNLHRQVIHDELRIGKNKLSQKNALEIVDKYDVVVDASDNPIAKYLSNDACVLSNKILVSCCALGWEGQLSIFNYNNGPCYRCLFPICPKNLSSCAENGVIGIIPGIIGMYAALETFKIFTAKENTLQNELLIYDGLACKFKKVKLRNKMKDCVVCGENKKFSFENFDYKAFTSGISCECENVDILNISWEKFFEEKNEKKLLLDVRPINSFNVFHVKSFVNVPLSNLKILRIEEIAQVFNVGEKELKENNIFVMCKRGISSKTASNFLNNLGLKNVWNIEGGLEKYIEKIDPSAPNI